MFYETEKGKQKKLTPGDLGRTGGKQASVSGETTGIWVDGLRGADTAGIRKRLNIACGVGVSLELIADVISALAGKLQTWQNRKLEPAYRSCFSTP